MPHFTVDFEDVASAASAATWKTALALACAAGKRLRVRSVQAGPSGEAAQDLNTTFELIRGTTDGTGTAQTPIKKDSLAVAAAATAKVNYSVEPASDLEANPIFRIGVNSRGCFIKDWGPDEAPRCEASEFLFLRFRPGAATAVKFSGTIEFEEF